MKTKSLAMLIVVTPILALGAGVAAGMLVSRLPETMPRSSMPGDAQSALTEELHLSADQRDQMRQVWEGAQSKVRQTITQAQNLQKERDDALIALLDAEGKAKFAQISREFADRDAQLTRDRDATFADAVGRTRTLLDASQREQYDRILRAHVGANAALTGASSAPGASR